MRHERAASLATAEGAPTLMNARVLVATRCPDGPRRATQTDRRRCGVASAPRGPSSRETETLGVSTPCSGLSAQLGVAADEAAFTLLQRPILPRFRWSTNVQTRSGGLAAEP